MSTVTELNDSVFNFLRSIKDPERLPIKEIRFCECFLDGVCVIARSLFDVKGQSAVDDIIF